MRKLTGYEYDSAILDLVYKYHMVTECPICGYPRLNGISCERCERKRVHKNWVRSWAKENNSGICEDRK